MKNEENLVHFGFTFEKGGTHLARTMMLKELGILLDYVDSSEASKEEYISAIINDNCLAKRSVATRKLTARHLVSLYSLNPGEIIFRSLVFFWQRDEIGRPLLALLSAYARDAMLRLTMPFILNIEEGRNVVRDNLEQFIEQSDPHRFSPSTIKSLAQNINSTWTQAGYTQGRVNKIRRKAYPTPGAASMALLLGYLTGARGEVLLETEYVKLLDCSAGKVVELVEEASRRGWITFKRIGKIIEVGFPRLINEKELEQIDEQN